jgi:hypothetical protein
MHPGSVSACPHLGLWAGRVYTPFRRGRRCREKGVRVLSIFVAEHNRSLESNSPATVQRPRAATRGPMASGIVLLAMVVAAANAAPVSRVGGLGVGLRVWGPGDSYEGDVVTPARLVAYPLIVERIGQRPGQGGKTSHMGELEGPPVYAGPADGEGLPTRGARAGFAVRSRGSGQTDPSEGTGIDRCLLHCVFRL